MQPTSNQYRFCSLFVLTILLHKQDWKCWTSLILYRLLCVFIHCQISSHSHCYFILPDVMLVLYFCFRFTWFLLGLLQILVRIFVFYCLFAYLFLTLIWIEFTRDWIHSWLNKWRVPDQNGVSQAWHIVETHHSGREPSKWSVQILALDHRSSDSDVTGNFSIPSPSASALPSPLWYPSSPASPLSFVRDDFQHLSLNTMLLWGLL